MKTLPRVTGLFYEGSMDTAINELRAITLREMELDKEKEDLRKRKLKILELDQGARKVERNLLTPENRKAQFAAQKRKAYERSKTQ